MTPQEYLYEEIKGSVFGLSASDTNLLNSAVQNAISEFCKNAWFKRVSDSYLALLQKLRISTKSDQLNFKSEVEQGALDLIPWRAGPYEIANVGIDAEWRSDIKWASLKQGYGSFKDKSIADVGSSSGFFSFRCAEDSAKYVLGIDPIDRCWMQSLFVQAALKLENTQFLPLGLSIFEKIKAQFDTVLCMGVLYHQREPLKALQTLKSMLKPGGELILETFIYPVNEHSVFKPEGRYCKMGNVFQIPSHSMLLEWLELSGFEVTKEIYNKPLDLNEQRTTKYAPFESLVDYLDKNDHSKTIEGHPAPFRTLLIAKT